MRALDLFCKAGGTGMGFYQAGFEVVGVDIEHQPRYPFEFHQADWLDYLMAHYHEFDLIVAGPPCQKYGKTKSLTTKVYPDLVGPVRDALQWTGKPYIIENVLGAPLINPLMLCGTMFGLRVQRHRLFESSPVVWWPPTACHHIGKTAPMWWGDLVKAGHKGGSQLINFQYITVTGHNFLNSDASEAMGIDWMLNHELSQAIPPAFTRWLGSQFLSA